VGKNVAVFVDVANIFYAAKAAGVDIDYVTLLKSATAGRDFVRAYAYTGLDPDNENQRNFHQFLARHEYKVVSKDIRKYGDGKVKANLDIELVVDMMKTARNLDIAVVVSGDGDFASAIRAVQEMGVRVEVISFRGNTSSDLMDVADLFTDITQIAKVDKGSTRSGRRVAGDEEDLSMTEVPEKQSEGTGRGRGRGRGRSRSDRDEAAAPTTTRSRGTAAATGGSLVALPGEKLSRAAPPLSPPPSPRPASRRLRNPRPANPRLPRPRPRRRLPLPRTPGLRDRTPRPLTVRADAVAAGAVDVAADVATGTRRPRKVARPRLPSRTRTRPTSRHLTPRAVAHRASCRRRSTTSAQTQVAEAPGPRRSAPSGTGSSGRRRLARRPPTCRRSPKTRRTSRSRRSPNT